jgi:hypothetical protein
LEIALKVSLHLSTAKPNVNDIDMGRLNCGARASLGKPLG